MTPLPAPIPLEAIRAARERIRGLAIRTPLLRFSDGDRSRAIYLKLENLQPIGSFKVRGAGNAMALAGPALERGVYTASAGNMAQGVAYAARERNVACSVVVPDNAPRTKLAAIERLGARIVRVTYDEWWKVLVDHEYQGMSGVFIHPVADEGVVAGNGTIGLEILEDLPDVDAVLVPFGGGGLSGGIASALSQTRPTVRVYAVEVETAAPFAASLAAGSPQAVAHTPSFVDGIGGKSMLPDMWPLARSVLAGTCVVSLEKIAAAIRLLAERSRVIAEGAGAASLAAALGGEVDGERIVCVVSGGNIDASILATILSGGLPGR